MFNKFKKAIHTDFGKYIVSIILGIGLAGLFRKSCTNKNCLVFTGPPVDDIRSSTYSHNNKCYQFKESAVKCNTAPRQVEFE